MLWLRAATWPQISLLIGFFQRHYSAEYDARERKLDSTAVVRQRSGLLLAFSLLQDVNASEMEYDAHFAMVMTPATAATAATPDRASVGDSHDTPAVHVSGHRAVRRAGAVV